MSGTHKAAGGNRCRREGNRIDITKVPYNTVRYLHETDAKMKRYHTCHCSLGHASHHLAGLDQELAGEILESVVKGDSRCRFVFHLPGKADTLT